jgi:DNA mismatch endonuclease, patch repair protein
MSRIRAGGNVATELKFIALLRAHRITGWRRNYPLFGKPDFVFPGLRVALFVDGCFWHGCPLHGALPSSNRLFWKKKLTANKVRDKVVGGELKAKGWKVIRVWQHELSSAGRLIRRIQRVFDN